MRWERTTLHHYCRYSAVRKIYGEIIAIYRGWVCHKRRSAQCLINCQHCADRGNISLATSNFAIIIKKRQRKAGSSLAGGEKVKTLYGYSIQMLLFTDGCQCQIHYCSIGEILRSAVSLQRAGEPAKHLIQFCPCTCRESVIFPQLPVSQIFICKSTNANLPKRDSASLRERLLIYSRCYQPRRCFPNKPYCASAQRFYQRIGACGCHPCVAFSSLRRRRLCAEQGREAVQCGIGRMQRNMYMPVLHSIIVEPSAYLLRCGKRVVIGI